MIKRILLVLLILLLPVLGWGTDKIVPSKDMTYLGAFKLPAPGTGFSWNTWDVGGNGAPGMEFLPQNATCTGSETPDSCCTGVGTGTCTGGTLIVLPTSFSVHRQIAKVSIPTPVDSKNLGDLNTATLLHAPVDIAKGYASAGYSFLGDIHYLPAKGDQTVGKLYWSIYGTYTTSCYPYVYCNGQFGWAEIDLDSLGSVGMWRFSNCEGESKCCGVNAKYLFHAPQAWADTYTGGKSLLTGYSRAGDPSGGPSIIAFAPWQEGNPPPDANDGAAAIPANSGYGQYEPTPLHVLPHQTLLNYEDCNSTGCPSSALNEKSPTDYFTSARWLSLGSKRAIVFSAKMCLRTFDSTDHSYPSNYYPGAYWGGESSGYHADPCSGRLLFYDQDDITATALETKEYYEPQPYASVDLWPYMIDSYSSLPSSYGSGGMAYDEINNKIYIQEFFPGYTSVVHVFQLTNSESTVLDTTPPSTPVLTRGATSKTSVTFTWEASTDDSGKPITYRILRNDRPIGIQTSLSATDSYLSYYPSPVGYKVMAIDMEGNTATSAELLIDDSVGGNVPLVIYIPVLTANSHHETSIISFILNEANSWPFGVRGGTAPYTWSLSGFPTGLSINSSGVVSGTATDSGTGDHEGIVTVVDANGNTHKRKTQVGASSLAAAPGYYYDKDRDGVCTQYVYGVYPCQSTTTPDPDDYNSEITPGITNFQPNPTGLAVIGTTESSVSLSWTKAADRTDPTAWGVSRQTVRGLDITYVVYHGTSPGIYPDAVFVGRALTYNWTGLSSGTHYFAVSAVEFRNLESARSTPVNQTLGGGDVTSPTLTSATIPGAGTSISLLFDEAVTRASETGWAITLSGGAVTMTYSSGSGTATLVYTLSRTVLQGQTGTVTWTAQANTIEDTSGNDLATLSLFGVTNNSTQAPTSGFNGSAFGAYYAEGLDERASIVQTSDGSVVMASTTYSYAWLNGPGTEVARGFLVKSSIDGVETWRKVYGPEGWAITTKQRTDLVAANNVHWAATKVIASGTDLIVVGYRGTTGAEGYNASLTKFNSSGVEQWDKTFNGATTGNDYFYDVVERTGGGFAVVGAFQGLNYDTDGLLILTDANGDFSVFTDVFGFSTNGLTQEYLSTVRKTADGGYIMAGWTDYGLGTEDYYVCKATSAGARSWCQKYDNAGRRDKANGVEEDASGNFWIFGRSQAVGLENTKIWIVKTNSAGVLQTSYTIGDTDNAHAYVPRHSIKLAGGNMLVIGYTNVSTGTGYHGYVTEIDTSGAIVGTPATTSPTTGYSESYLMSGVVSADGNYYLLAGIDNGSFSTAYDLWYLKMAVSDRSISNHTTCESKTTYYYDKDLDGNGNNAQWDNPTGATCGAMPGYVLTHGDVDDTNPLVGSPGMTSGSVAGGTQK